MFMYAFARSKQIDLNEKVYLSQYSFVKAKQGRYRLDKCCINPSVQLLGNHPLACIVVYAKRLVFELLLRAGNADRRNPSLVKRFARVGYYYSNTSQYIEMPFTHSWVKYCSGYFQSEKYFKKNYKVIREELRIKTVREECFRLGETIAADQAVCVHVRRGDYLGNEYYAICDEGYYRDAISLLGERVPNPVFYFFSNDIEWVKRTFVGKNYRYVDNGFEEYEDLYLMYHCKHFVLSNSTFSWWGQYLCDFNDKIVVAPDRWCNGIEADIKDIYCEGWTVINAKRESTCQ